ncbi:hypothetical protein LIER_19083 [Lithospermum erythrorhizon]|uniref:DUF4218 domain-containing protein n=1 Tax=Lithospermum erythrorhizon TaxID=34254 RepID=A0AAV3QJ08_LITER
MDWPHKPLQVFATRFVLTHMLTEKLPSGLPILELPQDTDEHKTHGYGQTHNWTKKSIFWELPYCPKLKTRHNIDIMHNEKNNGENYFFTTMDVKGKTKDTESSRKDLEAHTYRTSFFMTTKNGKSVKPKASYTLTKKQQLVVHTWLSKLKTPDGFSSNYARCSSSAKFTGLKSHDMHIIVQKLIPVAFRNLLPKPIWEILTKLCHFFRNISSSTLQVDHIRTLGHDIIETFCKLENIYPPSMFDVMEHLPVHMSYKTLMGGPVQYQWMYPFE